MAAIFSKINSYVVLDEVPYYILTDEMQSIYDIYKEVMRMSDKDAVSKKYLQDNARFADLFNFYLYGGRQVIQPDQLKPLDTTAITLPYGQDGKTSPVQKQRDLIKIVSAKSDEDCAYLLLAAELQSELHYAMPVRNMLYDAIQYTEQIETIAKTHRSHKDKAENIGEFLSGFYKADKLLPVITLTLYLGAGKWDAPKSLHEMLTVKDESLLKYIPDYKLNLITPADINDDELGAFRTELGTVLEFIKYSKDKKRIKQIAMDKAKFGNLPIDAAEMITTFGDFRVNYETRKETVNMCKAVEDWAEELLTEGKEEGIITTLADLVKNGIITVMQAAEQAKMPVEEFTKKAGLST